MVQAHLVQGHSGSSGPTSLLRQGHSGAQDRLQMVLEYLQ